MGGRILHLLDRVEQGPCQPGVTHRPVVTLDIGVLLRLAGLDVLDPDTLLLGSAQQHTDVLRAIVAADRSWLAAPLDDLFQRTDHANRWQREIDLDPESFAIEVAQHIE